MNLLTTYLKQYLAQDTTITSYTSTRIYEREIRGAGPEAADIYGPNGYVLPTIILNDVGGTGAPLGPQGAYNDRLEVTVIAQNSSDATKGRPALNALTTRLVQKLHRYQDPTLKAYLTIADRTGFVPDPSPETGAQERLTFAVAGTYAGVAT